MQLTKEEVISFQRTFKQRLRSLLPSAAITEKEVLDLTENDYGYACICLQAMRQLCNNLRSVHSSRGAIALIKKEAENLARSIPPELRVKRTDKRLPSRSPEPVAKPASPLTPSYSPQVAEPRPKEPTEEILQLRTFWEDNIGVLSNQRWTIRNEEAEALLAKRSLESCTAAIDRAKERIITEQSMNMTELAQEQCIAHVVEELNTRQCQNLN